MTNTQGKVSLGISMGTLLLLGVLVSIGPATTDIYFPALPSLQAFFSIDAAAAQTTLSVFLIGLACGQIIFGPLSDRYGRRLPLLAGLALFAGGSLMAAMSPTLSWLLAARFVQALGSSATLVVARAMVTDQFTGQVAARIHGLLMQIMAAVTILAPVLGGLIVVRYNWQTIFLFLAAIGVACLGAAWLKSKETLPADRRSSQGFTALIATWRQLLTNHRFVLLTLSSGFTMGAMYALLMGSSFAFVDQFGWQADHYGLLYGGTTVSFIVAAWANDLALRRYSPGRLIAWALPLQMLICLAMAIYGYFATPSPLVVAVVLCLLMANVAFVHGNLVAAVLEESRSAPGLGAGLLGVSQYGISAFAPLAAELAGGTAFVTMAVSTAVFAILAVVPFLLAQRQGLRAKPLSP